MVPCDDCELCAESPSGSSSTPLCSTLTLSCCSRRQACSKIAVYMKVGFRERLGSTAVHLRSQEIAFRLCLDSDKGSKMYACPSYDMVTCPTFGMAPRSRVSTSCLVINGIRFIVNTDKYVTVGIEHTAVPVEKSSVFTLSVVQLCEYFVFACPPCGTRLTSLLLAHGMSSSLGLDGAIPSTFQVCFTTFG